MAQTEDRPLRVLHLDHTTAVGGAELALLRMLKVEPQWLPLVLTPPAREGVPDVFAELVRHRTTGVAQPDGLSAGPAGAVLASPGPLTVQTVATRTHPGFCTADIVDANTTRAAAYGALAARSSRVPFVLHLREAVDPATLGGAGYRFMTRVALPRADGVIANSRMTLEAARPFLRRAALSVVIPSASGVRIGATRPARQPGPLRIGMLARIDPFKGQRLLLDAYSRVFVDSDIVLEFAGGTAPGREEYAASLTRHAVELGLADRVRLLGYVEDVGALLSRWDIAVQFATRPEPLGQYVLQYLAAGCVTVVADEGGQVDWVVDGVNGVRVPPRDVGALARTLRDLVEDVARRDRLGAAAATTPGLLDDPAVARAHTAFYRRVRARADRRRGARQ